MLHGDHADSVCFWGEDASGAVVEAINIASVKSGVERMGGAASMFEREYSSAAPHGSRQPFDSVSRNGNGRSSILR